MALAWKLKLLLFAYLWLMFVLVSYGQKAIKTGNRLDASPSVNKSFNSEIPPATASPPSMILAITETANDLMAAKNKPVEKEITIKGPLEPTKFNDSAAHGQMQVEESNYKNKVYKASDDIPDSFKTTFYFFVGLSSAAVLFILLKVYRMRLSRAERRYGVQGDRRTQEMTPLPISIEDANSDEDDQTLFEVNREQIRIL